MFVVAAAGLLTWRVGLYTQMRLRARCSHTLRQRQQFNVQISSNKTNSAIHEGMLIAV